MDGVNEDFFVRENVDKRVAERIAGNVRFWGVMLTYTGKDNFPQEQSVLSRNDAIQKFIDTGKYKNMVLFLSEFLRNQERNGRCLIAGRDYHIDRKSSSFPMWDRPTIYPGPEVAFKVIDRFRYMKDLLEVLGGFGIDLFSGAK